MSANPALAAIRMRHKAKDNEPFHPTLAFSLMRPKTKRDYRTFSTLAELIGDQFTEMYGVALTILVVW